MAYDPKDGNLSERDSSFLTSIRNKFLQSLLRRVGPNAVRGHFIGKILEEAERRDVPWQSVVARQLPVTVEAAEQQFPVTLADRLAIEHSRKSAAQYVTDVATETMEAIRAQVTVALEEKTPPSVLASQLFHLVGEANHDWRRIALTETAIAVNNGYVASLPEWTVVVGDSSFDACEWCKRHIHMRAFRSLPEAPVPAGSGEEFSAEQSTNYVWTGKTNVGRSRYPRNRHGHARAAHELWHPCVPAHPHCRCRLRRLIESVERIQPGTNLVIPK